MDPFLDPEACHAHVYAHVCPAPAGYVASPVVTAREAPVCVPLAQAVFTVVAASGPGAPLALGVFADGCRIEVQGSGDPEVDRRAWRKLAAVAALLAAGS